MAKHELWELKSMQSSPLSVKVALTKQRIREWVNHYGLDSVYVSFSGGKDSTVLLHIAREMYPEMKAVFIDTGLEFPEIRDFVKTFDNVDWVKSKMTFKQVIEKYGYPMISKEVSECVYGARRYLTSILESETFLTDRQLTNIALKDYADLESLKKQTRGGVRQQVPETQRNRRVYAFEFQKLTDGKSKPGEYLYRERQVYVFLRKVSVLP